MRIRTIKPEWLDDETLVLASPEARVLSIALILLADDYGNGRANPVVLAGRVFPGKVPEVLANALAELVATRFAVLYVVGGQQYFAIRNWDKHQKVDKPGKPQVPPLPAESLANDSLAKVPENVAKIPAALATDQDQDQDQDGKGSRAREALPLLGVVMTAFARRHETETRSAFQEHHKVAWPKVVTWLVATAALRKLEPAAFAEQVIGHWFADPWVREQRFPVSHFGRNFERYSDAAPARASPQRGQAKAASHADFERIVAEGSDVGI